MASATAHQHQLVLLLLVLALPAAMSACGSEVFPSGKTYVTCQDLPELGAALHWTYYAAYASGRPSLSLAFVAAPAAAGGWVAWGINPTGNGNDNGNGMVGTQALLAFVTSSSAPTVRTYNITSYYAVGAASTPIAFPATSLAADVGGGGGRIRLYATLQLDEGMELVNHVWQVGSSVTRSGAPAVHAMDPENLAARGTLALSAGTAASPPAHAGGSSGDRPSSWPPSGRQMSPAADTDSVSTTAHVVLALLGFWAMVG